MAAAAGISTTSGPPNAVVQIQPGMEVQPVVLVDSSGNFVAPSSGSVPGTVSLDSYTGTADQKMTAAIAAVVAAGGGTIQLGNSAYTFANQWTTSYVSSSVTTAIKIVGAGVAYNGAWGAPSAATVVTFTYAGAGAACMDFQHNGSIEITGMQFKSANRGVPLFQTTNASPNVHDCVFSGGGTGTGCVTDAIVCGGTGTTIGGGDTAPYQGYQGYIARNFFDGIRRGIRLQTYANAVYIGPNTWSASCGAASVFSVSDAAMTSGSAVLTSAAAGFTTGMVGAVVLVAGAGVSQQGSVLSAVIASRQSATQVTLSQTAVNTVAAAAAVSPSAYAIELDAGPAQMSGVSVDSCLIESTHYPVAIGMFGTSACTVSGTGFWDVPGGGLVGAAVFCNATAQGNSVTWPFNGYAAVGPVLAEETPGPNNVIDGTVASPRWQAAGAITFTGNDNTLGLAFGNRTTSPDIILQRAASVAVMTFLNNNGYLRTIAHANGSSAVGGRVTGQAHDGFMLGSDGSGNGVLYLGTGAAALDLVIQHVGTGLYGPGGTVAWMAYGGERWRADAQTQATYTIPANSRVVEANAASGAMTLTLTAGNDGELHTVIKTDSSVNTVTMQSTAGRTINGASTNVLSSQYQKATYMYSAALTAWLVVA